MATTTWLACLPVAISWRYRVQSRTCAFQLMAWIAVGTLFQAQLQVTTDLGWIPIGPGPFDEGTTGMGIPSRGHAARLTARPAGIF